MAKNPIYDYGDTKGLSNDLSGYIDESNSYEKRSKDKAATKATRKQLNAAQAQKTKEEYLDELRWRKRKNLAAQMKGME